MELFFFWQRSAIWIAVSTAFAIRESADAILVGRVNDAISFRAMHDVRSTDNVGTARVFVRKVGTDVIARFVSNFVQLKFSMAKFKISNFKRNISYVCRESPLALL